LSALGLAGCDAGSRTNDGSPPPDLHLVKVYGFDETGAQVEIYPHQGGKVALNTTFHLQFDRFLLPESAIRQAICVQSHQAPTPNDCGAPVSFTATYDPVNREVIYRLQNGTANGNIPLVAGTYEMTLFKPATTDPAAVGFRSFDGALIDKQVVLSFDVSANKAPGGVDPVLTAVQAWCGQPPLAGPKSGAFTILTGNCGVKGCHLNTNDEMTGKFLPAAMDLQFNTNTVPVKAANVIEVIQRTAINHAAHETQIGEHADQPQAAADRFGRAMPIISPQAAGNSYLLYKIVIGADTTTHVPYVDDQEEAQRLRDAFVVDDPMPLPNGAMALMPSQMNKDWLGTLSKWIQIGAPMPPCSNAY
jgi:hypothetical protein